jgi:hypothetical protein
MEYVSLVKILVILALLVIQNIVKLVSIQEKLKEPYVSVHTDNMKLMPSIVMIVLGNVFLVSILILNVLTVEETENHLQIVSVLMDIMKLMKKTVVYVDSDVILVFLLTSIVLYVLKTESMLQLVTVHTELIILMKLFVQIVT